MGIQAAAVAFSALPSVVAAPTVAGALAVLNLPLFNFKIVLSQRTLLHAALHDTVLASRFLEMMDDLPDNPEQLDWEQDED